MHELVESVITAKMFKTKYASVFDGDANWRKVKAPVGPHLRLGHGFDLCPEPALFRGPDHDAVPVADIESARVLALFLDSITTDHISPAGSIKAASPAGAYLTEHRSARPTSTSTAPGAATTK